MVGWGEEDWNSIIISSLISLSTNMALDTENFYIYFK